MRLEKLRLRLVPRSSLALRTLCCSGSKELRMLARKSGTAQESGRGRGPQLCTVTLSSSADASLPTTLLRLYSRKLHDASCSPLIYRCSAGAGLGRVYRRSELEGSGAVRRHCTHCALDGEGGRRRWQDKELLLLPWHSSAAPCSSGHVSIWAAAGTAPARDASSSSLRGTPRDTTRLRLEFMAEQRPKTVSRRRGAGR